MKEIIESKNQAEYSIIDCRFSYEYDGGHIKNSKNMNSIKDLENYFFSSTDNI